MNPCAAAGEAQAKQEAPHKRFVPAEAPAVSAWGRSSKLLFEPNSNGTASTETSTQKPAAPAAPTSDSQVIRHVA